jgi:hypothetical protein
MTRAEELRAMLAKARRYIASAEMLQQQGDYDSALKSRAESFVTRIEDQMRQSGFLDDNP